MIEMMILAFVAGFILEWIDSALGGGYGTVLTPVLLLMGFELTLIVPMILISEIFTGLFGGFCHNSFGHVDRKVIKYLVPFAAAGSFFAVLSAIKVDKGIINTYIGLLVLGLGILMFIKYIRQRNNGNGKKEEKGADGETKKHNWRLPLIGTVIGFNKALSGGGFGPIATAGISWSGYDPKKSVGSTTLAEGIVCVVGLLTTLMTKTITIDWAMAIPLWIGAVLACYPAAWAVHKTPTKWLGIAVAITVTLLGISLIMKMAG
jgi:hypothetical protein